MLDNPGAFLHTFASSAVYTAAADDAATPVIACIEDGEAWTGINAALRDTVNLGQVRLGRAWLLPDALPAAPAFGDTIEQLGRTWTVQDSWPEGDMLVLGLAQGALVVAVTVQRDQQVSDGALGYKTVPVDIWSGRAAVHGLSGRERVLAARTVGVGIRTGWMAACPDLAPGCSIVTPHERLHVTSAYTDHDRGWTIWEAEARQEGQS